MASNAIAKSSCAPTANSSGCHFSRMFLGRGRRARGLLERQGDTKELAMAEQNKQQGQKKDFASWKPGSESAEAKNVGGEGDFGAPVGAGPDRDRDYVNENTKRADPGAT